MEVVSSGLVFFCVSADVLEGHELVEFAYHEKAFVHYQIEDPTSFIPTSFITASLASCVEKWNPYLPDTYSHSYICDLFFV